MAFFEPYRPELGVGERRPGLEDLLVRPAALQDVSVLAGIEAEREGGDATDHARRLESAILGPSDACLILTAEHAGLLVGIGKTRRFARQDLDPPNVAPDGWYLSGVIVRPEYRRRGVARRLIAARLDWIALRDSCAYYFANIQNQTSIKLHEEFGFVEVTRDFYFPGVTLTGGVGVLFRVELLASI